ncbi:MAG: DUF1553 domain-containing protein, partial [Candidatus Omnitrophica bacterium]|nr:DUF1553 domain-containing protein [Candidatus Omnitrophota bacterium]
LRPGGEVKPDIPNIFGNFPADLPRNRLGLAQWLVSPENPLVSRVTVNRIWQQIFGRGIVETSEDFGMRGSPPSHPELLDWLATEFVEKSWSVKDLIRTIVTSSVYRQSSRISPELLERDPYNALLARGPRFRMNAETIRDNALAVSGLLNRTIGGPSVFPYQPPGIWSEIGSPGYGVDEWIPNEGANRFRRGVYTYWRRSNPYPSFIAFDAPTREYCTVKRPITNTPLQALVTLNDPVFLQASMAFASRLLEENGNANPEEILDRAFRICLCRPPTDFEAERLLSLEREQRNKFQNSPASLQEAFSKLPIKGESSPDLAAWTVVCQVLLNLDETLTKG